MYTCCCCVNMSRTSSEVFDFDSSIEMPNLIKPIVDHKALAREKKRIIFETHYSNCEDKCAICLSNMINATVKHTPCGHTFHLRCLTKWQKFQNERNVQCPNCRAALPRLRFIFPFMENYPTLMSPEEEREEEYEDESSDDELIAVSVNLARTRHTNNQDFIDEINAAEEEGEVEAESERESVDGGEEDEYGRSLVRYDADF